MARLRIVCSSASLKSTGLPRMLLDRMALAISSALCAGEKP